MKCSILASLVASAVAFAPAKEPSRVSVALNGALEDLKAIAEKSNPVLKVSWAVPYESVDWTFLLTNLFYSGHAASL